MKTFCRHPECYKVIGPKGWYYCREHESDLDTHLLHVVTPIVKASKTFYIGRTSYPERRLLEHLNKYELDQMVILHWAGDWDESDTLEEWLIEEFKRFSRCLNDSDCSHGKHSSPWNCVYIAYTLKSSDALCQKPNLITDLDTGKRQWPIKGCPMKPVYLKANVGTAEASKILDAYYKT